MVDLAAFPDSRGDAPSDSLTGMSALISRDSNILWATLLIVAMGKILLFLSVGMVLRPDSSDYVGYADAILRSREWLVEGSLYGLDFRTFRSLGYPLFIALSKIISSDHWMSALFAIQLSATLVSCWALYRLAFALTSSTLFGAFVVLAHAFSQLMVLDQSVLADSLNAALLVTAISILGHDLLQRRRMTIARTLLLTSFVTVAFLVREAGAFLQFTIWPMFIAAAFAGGANWMRTLALLLVFSAPVFLAKQAYQEWNAYRTGERFVTLGAATTMFRPVVDLARRDVPVYEIDRYLNDVSRLPDIADATPGQSYALIRQHLINEHDMNMVGVGGYGFELFFEHWFTYPLERARIFLRKIDETILFSPVMPFKAHDRLLMTAGAERFYPGSTEALIRVFDFDVKLIAFLIGLVVARVVSSLICAAFLFGVPWVVVRAAIRSSVAGFVADSRLCFLTTGWMLFLGYLGAYAAVHLEVRYLLPVLPFVTIIGGYLLIEGLREGARRVVFLKSGGR